jgi:MFS family permease
LEGLRLVRRERTLSTIFAMSLLMGLGEGIFGVLLVVFVRLVLRGGALQYGSLMSAQAIGGLLGGVAVGLVGQRFRPARLLGWCAFTFGLVDLLIVDAPAILDHAGGLAAAIPSAPGLSAALLVVLALFVVVGLPGAGVQTALNTLIQSAVPERLMGRVFGAMNALMALTMLGGMILAGGLGDRLGPVPLLNLQGSMYALAGLLALARLRGRWAAPRPAASPPAPAPPASDTAGAALGAPPGRHT